MDERLLWGEHVKADWRLEKPTSKSNFSEIAEFDLRLLPTVMQEPQRTPATSRIGPVILDERIGKPYRQREFARRFREVARGAGVPNAIWNMVARAGAVTDAYVKGAQPTDVMDLETHTQLATNRRYSRNRLVATSRVAVLRFGGKNEPGKGARNKERSKPRREGSRNLARPLKSLWCGRRGRTRTALRPRDFKSALIPYPVCIQQCEALR